MNRATHRITGKRFGAATIAALTRQEIGRQRDKAFGRQLIGDWAMVRGDGNPICGLVLTNNDAGNDNFQVFVKPKCDAKVAAFAPTQWRLDHGQNPVAEICEAKVQATLAFEFCAREAAQILGGASYLRGNVVERLYREVRVQAIGGGSEEIMRDLAARQMGF